MKHRRVYDHLHDQIARGELGAGDRLPTEVELASRFQTSRPTAAKALNLLEAEGLISRRAGSGSFVLDRGHARQLAAQPGVIGLLIHRIGHTEIFEPVCAAIAAEAEKAGQMIRLSTEAADGPDLLATCRRLIRDGVAGVFFAPVEYDEATREMNGDIVRELAAAGIPAVLLDRDCVPYPERSSLDLVGLHNYRAGYLLGQHFLSRGAEQIGFVARPGSAATVRQRHNGVAGALYDHSLHSGNASMWMIDPGDVTQVRSMLDSLDAGKRTAIACANDITAGELLHSLRVLGIHVPGDFIVGSFDDVRFARLLRPALTSVHQPTSDIGRLAWHAMATRIAQPDLPAREIRVEGRLIVRDSSAGFGASFY